MHRETENRRVQMIYHLSPFHMHICILSACQVPDKLVVYPSKISSLVELLREWVMSISKQDLSFSWWEHFWRFPSFHNDGLVPNLLCGHLHVLLCMDVTVQMQMFLRSICSVSGTQSAPHRDPESPSLNKATRLLSMFAQGTRTRNWGSDNPKTHVEAVENGKLSFPKG